MKKKLLCFALSLLLLPLFEAKAFAQPQTLSVSAVSAIVINADTGSIVYEKSAFSERAMASTTKIMTALLTAEAGDLDRKFTADGYAIQVEGTSMGLQQGDIVTRRALLYGMLLPSGNDAANAAAVSVSGSMGKFVELMNEKAQSLGLKNTRFANPSGLDADGHFTTAYDLAMLTRAALQNPVFAEICRCADAEVEFGNPPYLRRLANSNKMLWQYEGCYGVKTGFTDNARRCLVSAAERGGVRLICVTLNAPDDWEDHRKMLDYGFGQVKRTELVLPSPLSVPVIGGNKDKVSLVLSEKVTLPLSQSEIKAVSFELYAEPFLYAGFKAGEKAGKAEIYLDGEYVCEVDLISSEGVEVREEKLGFFEGVIKFLRLFFFG